MTLRLRLGVWAKKKVCRLSQTLQVADSARLRLCDLPPIPDSDQTFSNSAGRLTRPNQTVTTPFRTGSRSQGTSLEFGPWDTTTSLPVCEITVPAVSRSSPGARPCLRSLCPILPRVCRLSRLSRPADSPDSDSRQFCENVRPDQTLPDQTPSLTSKAPDFHASM